MTETIKLDKINQKEITKKIKSGDIFIYPTDIGYCIGCDALKSGSVSIIKQTIKSKLSIISPNKQWISKNFEIINKNYIKKLPGPYTFILKSFKINIIKKFPDHHTLNFHIFKLSPSTCTYLKLFRH